MKTRFTQVARKTDPSTSHRRPTGLPPITDVLLRSSSRCTESKLTDEELFHQFEGHAHEQLHPFASPQSDSDRAWQNWPTPESWSGQESRPEHALWSCKCQVWKVMDGFQPGSAVPDVNGIEVGA